MSQDGQDYDTFDNRTMSDGKEQSVPVLVTANAHVSATMPARVVLLQKQSILDTNYHGDDKSRPYLDAQALSIRSSERRRAELRSPGKGKPQTQRPLPLNPVSTQLMDLDDILTNGQFHKRTLKTDSLLRKFEFLKK